MGPEAIVYAAIVIAIVVIIWNGAMSTPTHEAHEALYKLARLRAGDEIEHQAARAKTAESRLAEAVAVIQELVTQIEKFAEEQGEADFYTGAARAFLAQSSEKGGG